MRILLISDGRALAPRITEILEAESLIVRLESRDRAVALALATDPDLIVLCIDDPSDTSEPLECIEYLRSEGVRTPLLVVSADRRLDTTLAAFRGGADDYLAAPYHPEELTARVRALIRRDRGHPHRCISIGNVVLDLDDRTVSVGGVRLRLSSNEYYMLELLMLRADRTVPKRLLLEHAYGHDQDSWPKAGVLSVRATHLRKKLAEAGARGITIKADWGKGFLIPRGKEG